MSFQNDNIRKIHRGFTLIELLVTLGTIVILIALILPAAMSARESARSISCRNNLRQTGLALHAYHDSHNGFPPGNVMLSGWDSGRETGINWGLSLLPYIEQNNVWASYDSNSTNQSFQNQTVRSAYVTTYQCPSDTNAGSAGRPWSGPGRRLPYATGSYRGVAGRSDGVARPGGGSWFDAPNTLPPSWQGILPQVGTGVRNVRVGGIIDGTANTLAIGEYYSKPCPLYGNGTPCRRTTFWAYSYTSYGLSSICPECGPRLLLADFDACVNGGKDFAGGADACKRAWGSFHSTLHFLLCDGSARSFSKDTEVNVLADMATVGGNEIVNHF